MFTNKACQIFKKSRLLIIYMSKKLVKNDNGIPQGGMNTNQIFCKVNEVLPNTGVELYEPILFAM